MGGAAVGVATLGDYQKLRAEHLVKCVLYEYVNLCTLCLPTYIYIYMYIKQVLVLPLSSLHLFLSLPPSLLFTCTGTLCDRGGRARETQTSSGENTKVTSVISEWVLHGGC